MSNQTSKTNLQPATSAEAAGTAVANTTHKKNTAKQQQQELLAACPAPENVKETKSGSPRQQTLLVADSFDAMGLRDNLLRGIFSYGFETPSAIQQKAILPMTSGKDIIAQAQSGTGKTATFCIGILQQLDLENPCTQALVLAPTRELADQSRRVMLELGDYLDVTVQMCVGGTQVKENQRLLSKGAQVVVGTPGRTLHMIQHGHLRLDGCNTFCLDEADEMLSMGFQDQIR